MKKNISPEEIIDKYIEIGTILKETTLSGDYKKGNKERNKIIKLFKLLEADLELARRTLPELFYNENVVTSNKAAAHCLSLNICVDEALRVLKNAKDDEKNGIFGFEAEMTLKVWHKQGYLKVYPEQKIYEM